MSPLKQNDEMEFDDYTERDKNGFDSSQKLFLPKIDAA